ncbi:Cell division cycle protein 20 like protein B [Fukomys damarensis]|uniref:Cell division cycle protein 20 like protein B n=1 Tax=Fukomys damarensis TaxID=885580 RepID=A0A091DPA9_FUKDA|nr:Cell division cycle protein 20 like protein B [Fukomys damarensis]
MEWKLERTARRKIRTEEEMLWVFDSVTTPYSNFKSNIVKRLSGDVPVASSPLATRWQQSQIRDLEACSFGDEYSIADISESGGSVLQITSEKGTLTLGSYEEPLKTPVRGSSQTNNSAVHFCKASHTLERNRKENVSSNSQNCLDQLFSTRKVIQQINGKMQLCEDLQCIWEERYVELFLVGCTDGVRNKAFHLKKFRDVNYPIRQPEVKIHLTGLRNDYYLNILDWSFQNLVAVALGSVAYIWNGENHTVESIDLSPTCNYVSSVSWIKKGTCLAVGTSEGEVQLWDVVTKKRLRNMQGHLSVVGALSWNHCILSSGSRLGRVYHHDVRAAQHQVGTLCHKQAVCALKWSPDGRLLSSGCSDGLLTIWPQDPGAHAQGQSLRVVSQSTAVKAIDWCPWQSEVLAIGGGMKDGCLHILDINSGKSIQTPSTNSQICSLIWLPKTMAIATGQGAPKNDVTLWTCPTLSRSSGFLGHRGRVLHLALSPDQTQVFSAAADGTACVWNCHETPRPF